MRSTRLMRFAAAGLALGLGAAACGSGRDNGGSASGGGAGNGGTSPGGSFTIDTKSCEGYNGTAGISDSEIKLGTSMPLSGVYGTAFSAIKKGWDAYFKYLNDNGGVNGKKITVVTKDDEYNAGKSRTNVQELVEKDKVFAIFNAVGTPSLKAVRDDLNAKCVPDLFVATGTQLAGEVSKYPWVIGSIPAYPTEAGIFVDYLKKNKPNAKLGIVKQNDDFGEGYSAALKKAIEGTGITIVKEEKVDEGASDVNSQITTMANSGVDTVFLGITALACPNGLKSIKAQGGWNPLTYLSATCSSKLLVNTLAGGPEPAKGVITTVYLKDPVNPKWANDAGLKTFQEQGKKYGLSDEDAEDGTVVYGWTMGQLLAETLKRSPSLDRKAVMETAYTLKSVELPMLLPGVVVNTNGAQDPFPIEAMQIGKYDGTTFVLEGEVINIEGKTKSYTPSS